MRRILASLFMMFALIAPVAASQPAFAAEVIGTCTSGTAATTDVCKSYNANKSSSTNPIVKVIKGAILILSYIIGIAAIIGILINGIRFMTSGGDSQSIATARTGLIYSVVGLLIAALAGSIVAFVLSRF